MVSKEAERGDKLVEDFRKKIEYIERPSEGLIRRMCAGHGTLESRIVVFKQWHDSESVGYACHLFENTDNPLA